MSLLREHFDLLLHAPITTIIKKLHQNPILPTDLFFINFCQLSKFKIKRIRSFSWNVSFSFEQTVQFEENLDTFHQPIKCQDKLMNQISANQIAAIIPDLKRKREIIARRVLFCVDNGRISRLFPPTFLTTQSFKWSLQPGFQRWMLLIYSR